MHRIEPAKCCRCGSFLSIDPAQEFTKCNTCGTVDETGNLKNAFLLEYVPRSAEENISVQQEILLRMTGMEEMLRELSDKVEQLSRQLDRETVPAAAPPLQPEELRCQEDVPAPQPDPDVFISEEAVPVPSPALSDVPPAPEEPVTQEKAAPIDETESDDTVYDDSIFRVDEELLEQEEIPEEPVPEEPAALSHEEDSYYDPADEDLFPETETDPQTEEQYSYDTEDGWEDEAVPGASETQGNVVADADGQWDDPPFEIPASGLPVTEHCDEHRTEQQPAFFRHYLPGDPDDTESTAPDSQPSDASSPEMIHNMSSAFVSSASMEEFEMLGSLPEPVSLQGIPREHWRELESIYIPGDFLCEESQFKGFEKLRRVVFGEGVKLIQPSMFEDCISLQEVTLPEGMYGIFTAAFRNCRSLVALYCPTTLNQIGKLAFADCTSLQKVQFTSCVSLGIEAFSGCTALQVVDTLDLSMPDPFLPDNLYHPNRRERMNTIIKLSEQTHDHEEYMLVYNSYPDLFIYPDHYIPEEYEPYTHHFSLSCFKNCTSLTSLDVPFGITHIEYDAFAGCSSLTYLYLPPTVAVLSGHALIGCPHAKAYYYDIELPAQEA